MTKSSHRNTAAVPVTASVTAAVTATATATATATDPAAVTAADTVAVTASVTDTVTAAVTDTAPAPLATPSNLAYSRSMSLDALKYDDQGLVAVIAQDAETGEVRMMAYANEAAIARTLEMGVAHFYSRSRQQLWKKGESSGNTLAVRSVWVDCDGDTLIYMVDPEGPSCHTGAETCFFRKLGSDGQPTDAGSDSAAPTLLRLERTLQERKVSDAGKSYTKSLLDAGPAKIDAKLREEAAELGQALIGETDERVASESGDVIYHLLVGLVLRKVPLRSLLAELSKRFAQSGHEEKANR